MARWLTPLRAVLVVLLAGILLGAAMSRPERIRVDSSSMLPETRELFTAERAAATAFAEWRTAVIVDSIRSSLAASPASPWMVSVSAGVPEWIVDGVRSAAEGASSSVISRAGAPGVSIAVVLDTLAALGEWELSSQRARDAWVDHVISPYASEPCLIIIRVRRPAMLDDVVRDRYLARIGNEIPGTCGIVAQFGAPGPGIRDWLRRTNGDFARISFGRDLPLDVVPQGELSVRHVWWPSADDYEAREYGCFTGRIGACTSWLDSTRRAPSQLLSAGDASGGKTIVLGRSTAFVPEYKNYFVADLIRTRGTDAFAAMWTSEGAFSDAFQTTYGESAGSWAVRWHREIGFPLLVELRSPWKGVPLSLLAMLAFVAGAMGYATRRTAGGN